MKVRSLLALSGCLVALGATDVTAQWPIPLSNIESAMNATAANYPSIAMVVNLTQKYGMPQTWQGNDIFAMKISDNVALEEDEETFLMVSAHHGNEYGTPVVALDAIERLTQLYGSDPTITNLVDTREIWIAPVWNPDGYPTSRRNRQPERHRRPQPQLSRSTGTSATRV